MLWFIKVKQKKAKLFNETKQTYNFIWSNSSKSFKLWNNKEQNMFRIYLSCLMLNCKYIHIFLTFV